MFGKALHHRSRDQQRWSETAGNHYWRTLYQTVWRRWEKPDGTPQSPHQGRRFLPDESTFQSTVRIGQSRASAKVRLLVPRGLPPVARNREPLYWHRQVRADTW